MVNNPDSLEGILELAQNYAITLKTEGGVGFCANFLRPANTLIRKIGVTTPGAIKFLELFDKLSEIITSGNVNGDTSYQGTPTKKSIRKGATMVTMSICHPDIEEFITAKSIPNKLTKMNMSVLITDAFIYAMKNDLDWDLWFPDITFDKYDTEWDGDFEKWGHKGYPFIVYKTVKAVYLWDLLLRNTFNRSEPGILFIDNARRMDNLHYLEDCTMHSTNPCAEIFGNTGKVIYEGEEYLLGDVCNLGSVNVTKFYDVKTKEFKTDELLDAIDILIRSLDNIIDISNYPLPIHGNAAKLKRKIGVGMLGVGSLMMMMNLRYGGDECIIFFDDLLDKVMNKMYQTSTLMAKELGPFELYDKKLLDGGYVKNSGVLSIETVDMIKKYGLRHSALSAIAPNGTLSIVAGNVSGGLEPVFANEFNRWNRVEGKSVDFKYPNVHKGEWFETDYFKEQKVGGESILISKDKKYRIDRNSGLCEQTTIKDYGYSVAEKYGFKETLGAMELSVKDHLNVLSVFASKIDQSSSKTINLPSDISFEDFKKLYGEVHSLGIKGCTTYREGSSIGVLEVDKKEKSKTIKKQQKEFIDVFKEQTNESVVVQSVKLPEQYPSSGYILRSEGKKWYIHVAFKDKACTRPFALFVNTNNREDNVVAFNALDKLEEVAIKEGMSIVAIEVVKRKYGYQKNPVKICRMLGFLLRHNIRIYKIVKALDDVEGAFIGTFVFRIKKFLAQFIKHIDEPTICPDCKENSLVFTEGCYTCKQCGYSKCG
jgi:ribonucleoside-diphosphate reductase alpha chain